MAPATIPPISKKLPPVAAVPIRKKRVSGPVAATARAAMQTAIIKSKLAQAKPRQQYFRIPIIVSRGETAMDDDTMLHRRLQPNPRS
jgi:hypothetical protein